jgi:hypothetical protein
MPPLTCFRVSRLLMCFLIASLAYAGTPWAANPDSPEDGGVPVAGEELVLEEAAPKLPPVKPPVPSKAAPLTPPTETPPPTPTPEPPTLEPLPTPTPTATPAPPAPTLEPTITPPLMPNTDSLVPVTVAQSVSLAPGGTHIFAFTYLVTTPRTGTSLHVELRHADGMPATGWLIDAQAGNSAGSSGGAIDLADTTAVMPASTFGITLAITAPGQTEAQNIVSLHIRSTVTTERGDLETGLGDAPALTTLTLTPVQDDPVDVQASAAEAGMLDCVRVSPIDTDAIDFGQYARFSCSYTSGPVRLRVNSLTEHWQYRVNDGPWNSLTGQASLTPASGKGGKMVTYLIDLRFTGDLFQVPPGSQGQVEIEITNPAGQSFSPEPVGATLTATRIVHVVPTADDFELMCIPTLIIAAVGESPVEVTCTFRGKDSLEGRQVTLNHVVAESPEGWILSAEGMTSGGSLTFLANEPISAGTAYEITFFASPGACEAQSGSIVLRSLFTFEDSDPLDGPGATLNAVVGGGLIFLPGVDAEALYFGTSFRVDSGYTPVTGTLAITILPPGDMTCATLSPNWSIEVSTDGLYQDSTEAQIPAESFTFLGTQSGFDVPGGLVPFSDDLLLVSGAATTIATGDDLIGEGGTWNAEFRLSPPDDVPPGTYGGTIEIMIVNAP